MPQSGEDHSYGLVYTNQLATPSILSKASFQAGSIIVREKLRDKVDTKAEKLTIMIKREKGFNAQYNDWQFLVLDGDGKDLSTPEKLATCYQCHQSQAENDFVFKQFYLR